jgi:hypothetical protein
VQAELPDVIKPGTAEVADVADTGLDYEDEEGEEEEAVVALSDDDTSAMEEGEEEEEGERDLDMVDGSAHGSRAVGDGDSTDTGGGRGDDVDDHDRHQKRVLKRMASTNAPG